MLNIGHLIDERFEVKKILQSSPSIVYLCADKVSKEFVVLKAMAQREALLLKKLDNPFIVKIICEMETCEGYFLVEEYVKGQMLYSLPLKEKPMDYRLAVYIAKQLCETLIYLHSQKPPVIYRDLKPTNIIINSKGQIKLIDFGAAKEYELRANEDKESIGTVGYAAPEQYQGEGQSDIRSDIYGFGAVLYYLVTGDDVGLAPHTIFPVIKFRADVPEKINDIIKKCTKQSPEERYQSMQELLYDLENIEGKEEVKEKKIRKRKLKAPNANPVALALLLLSFMIYIAGFIFGIGIATTKTGEVNFTLAGIYWFIAFAFGTIIMGLSQIIKLLNDLRNHFYE